MPAGLLIAPPRHGDVFAPAGLPLLMLGVAVFSVPVHWSPTGKLLYAGITYLSLVTLYSFVNIPYGSLASVMTQMPQERAALGMARTVMAAMTASFLAWVIGDLLHDAHGSELQRLLTRFTLILAVLGAFLYYLCFTSSREIVPRLCQRISLQASLASLAGNRPLQILCLVAFFMLCGSFSLNASMIFYVRYVLGDPRQFLPLMLITLLLGSLLSVPLISLLVRPLGKKGVFLSGCAISAVAYGLLFIFPALAPVWRYGCFSLASTGMMMAVTVLWALQGDTVEYGEWRHGVRVEGLAYAVFSFARKCGQALGGSLPAFLLAMSDYVPNAPMQSEAALMAIRQATMLVPTLTLSAAFLLMCFYPLSDQGFLVMLHEIRQRTPSLHGDPEA